MPEFIADTSGIVLGSPKPWSGGAGVKHDGCYTWHSLDSFTQGYIEALLFTWPEDDGDYVGGISAPAFDDFAGQTLESIITDCLDFQAGPAAPLLTEAYKRDYDSTQAGRDFWFTRCGHGVGYWDRPALESDAWERNGSPRVGESGWAEYVAQRDDSIGNQLSELARAAGNVDQYLGDDGKVYLS